MARDERDEVAVTFGVTPLIRLKRYTTVVHVRKSRLAFAITLPLHVTGYALPLIAFGRMRGFPFPGLANHTGVVLLGSFCTVAIMFGLFIIGRREVIPTADLDRAGVRSLPTYTYTLLFWALVMLAAAFWPAWH